MEAHAAEHHQRFDVKDARQFSVLVPGSTFTSVDVSFDPLSLEHSRSPL